MLINSLITLVPEELGGQRPEPTLGLIIAAPPAGHLPSWDALKTAIIKKSPLYLFVLANEGKGNCIQIQDPTTTGISCGVWTYGTGEIIAVENFFNRDFLPTFFVFDNYMHAYALKQRLIGVGRNIQIEKFK